MHDTVENSNLKLWNSVQTTNTKFTKHVDEGGRKYTAISGAYMEMQATRLFGPKGIGWGVNVVEERYDQGVPVLGKDGAPMGFTQNHTVKILLWFKLNGERGEIEAYGCTPYITYVRRWNALAADEEAPKKSLTDATKKALSGLGMCADIFLGMYDVPEYREAVEREQRIEEAEDKVAEEERQWQEAVKCGEDVVALIEACPNYKAAHKAMLAGIRKLTAHGPDAERRLVPRIHRRVNELAKGGKWKDAPQIGEEVAA